MIKKGSLIETTSPFKWTQGWVNEGTLGIFVEYVELEIDEFVKSRNYFIYFPSLKEKIHLPLKFFKVLDNLQITCYDRTLQRENSSI